MSGPLQVAIVARPQSVREAVPAAVGRSIGTVLIGALWLMLLLPLLTETLRLPRIAPGYLTCMALVFLGRGVVSVFFPRSIPQMPWDAS